MTVTGQRSLFITLEGGEGAGKTTLAASLEKELARQGLEVLRTREPGGVPLSEAIRGWLLHSDLPINARAELLLFLAARAQHVADVIQPALGSHKVVICDRFNDSSLAYQGWGRGLPLEAIAACCGFACAGVNPDLTFFLDIDPQKGLERTRQLAQGDRIDRQELAFHQKVRQGFLQLACDHPQRIQVLDGALPPHQVLEQALSAIQQKLCL